MFWFFGQEACGILAPRPGIKPAPTALEDEVLTTGPPGKSQQLMILREQKNAEISEGDQARELPTAKIIDQL